MGIVAPAWYVRNEGRAYPVAEDATQLSDDGLRLPSDLIADMRLSVPGNLVDDIYLSAVTVSKNLFTVIVAGVKNDNHFMLASVSLLKPISGYKITPLQTYQTGVTGWVVAGSGANLHSDLALKFSSPNQTRLMPQAAWLNFTLQQQGLAVNSDTEVVGGVVLFDAGDPLELVGADRVINGKPVRAIVLRLKPGVGGVNYQTFAGKCGGRPESNTCQKTPVETISGVRPNCDGVIKLEFRGCAEVFLASTTYSETIVVDCANNFSKACTPTQFTTPEGILPNDYVDECNQSIVGSSFSPLGQSLPRKTDEMLSLFLPSATLKFDKDEEISKASYPLVVSTPELSFYDTLPVFDLNKIVQCDLELVSIGDDAREFYSFAGINLQFTETVSYLCVVLCLPAPCVGVCRVTSDVLEPDAKKLEWLAVNQIPESKYTLSEDLKFTLEVQQWDYEPSSTSIRSDLMINLKRPDTGEVYTWFPRLERTQLTDERRPKIGLVASHIGVLFTDFQISFNDQPVPHRVGN